MRLAFNRDLVEYNSHTLLVDYAIWKVWNENPGSDIMIGTATLSARHVRALALLDGQTARVLLALSRNWRNGRLETQGALVARARLVRDKENTCEGSSTARRLQSVQVGHMRSLQVESSKVNGEKVRKREETHSTIDDGGYITFFGLTVHDLPQTEGLMFGGAQDPYVMLTLGSTRERSTTISRVGKLCEWRSQLLRFKLEPGEVGKEGWGDGLAVEIWNDNRPRKDASMGKGLLRAEKLRELLRGPGMAVSCRVKLSRGGRGRKGTLSMTALFEPEQSWLASPTESPSNQSFDKVFRTLASHPTAVVVTNFVAKDLRNTVALGFGGLDTQEPYVVARVGCSERITPSSSITGATARWDDSRLTLPLRNISSKGRLALCLELWNANPVQDDLVGFAEVNIADILLSSLPSDSTVETQFSDRCGRALPLDVHLQAANSGKGDHLDTSPGVLSCTVALELQNDDGNAVAQQSIATSDTEAQEVLQNDHRTGVCLPTIDVAEGPGLLKVTVLEAVLSERVEAPEVRLTLLPGKRFASTRPLLAVGGDSSTNDDVEVDGIVRCAWEQELEIPCYSVVEDNVCGNAVLHADIVAAGVLAGQRVLGHGRADVAEAIRSGEPCSMSLDVFANGRGSAPFIVGRLSLVVRFADAWQGYGPDTPPSMREESRPELPMPCLQSHGVVRVFVIDAKELLGLDRSHDPYVMVERLAVHPTTPFQGKPFSSGVAIVTAGKEARWAIVSELFV